MRAVMLACWAVLSIGQLSFASTLTGVSFFTAGPQGNTTLEVWNTLGSDLPFNLYLSDGVTSLNSGNGSGARINIPLTITGTYAFVFRAQPALQSPGQFGVNFFFNGNDSTPGISAVVSANSSTFAVNGAPLTNRLDGGLVAGAGTLVFADGFYRVTLTALSQARSGGNQVSGYANSPGLLGGNDYQGGFTLSVATPEPAAYFTLGSLLVLMGVWRRRAS